MKRFEFRLARLLRVRSIEEDVARASWARAELRAGEAEQRRRALSSELAAARDALARELGCGVPLSPAWITLAQRALDGLAVALRARTEEALTLRGQADAEARAWRERRSRRRGLEELESRARARHGREREAAEAAQQDEASSARAVRARAPGAGTAPENRSRPG